MGSVMSYSLALAGERPAPAGILALSGFMPTVEGWQPHLADRTSARAFIAHGRHDPIMDVDFARSARDLLEAGGLERRRTTSPTSLTTSTPRTSRRPGTGFRA